MPGREEGPGCSRKTVMPDACGCAVLRGGGMVGNSYVAGDYGSACGARCETRRFLLDFGMNVTDNYSVERLWDLIYSPSDMPQGLWRGFAFGGGRAEGVYHAR